MFQTTLLEGYAFMKKVLKTTKTIIRYMVVSFLIICFLALSPSKGRAGAGSDAADKILAVSAVTVVLMIVIAMSSRSFSYSELDLGDKDSAKDVKFDTFSDRAAGKEEGEYKIEVSLIKW